jgi:hypothetical protein
MVVLAACGGDGKKQETQVGGLEAQVASYDLAVGAPARIIVGLLTSDHRFVGFGTVSMRFGYMGTREAPRQEPFGPPVRGSFLPIHGTEVPSPLPATPRVVGAHEGRGVYAGRTAFDRAGFWQVEVTAEMPGGTRRATTPFAVAERHAVPAPGDQALPTDNLTLSSADAPRPAIDSRAANGDIPDPELHRTTIAAALQARRPVVAVFATPVYCQSQFCGPVTDMVQELARDYGDRASFVHVEVWRDYEARAINRSAGDWLYRDTNLTEPWVFLVGADGRVVDRFDNVATREEIEPWLRALPVVGPAP